jgi:hypothetical protein
MASALLKTALLLLPFAVFACASSSDEGAQGDDQNIKAGGVKPGESGATCGGLAGLRCKSGLDCRLVGNFPDAPGTCGNPSAKPGEAGGLCGGLGGFVCQSGLHCQKSQEGLDISGVCAAGDPPIATCQAIPACTSDEEATQSCAPTDTSCTTRTICGHIINCKKKAPELTLEGKLQHVSGIGGETTGFAIVTSVGMTELALDGKEPSEFVDGRFARVKGRTTTVTGVEIKVRSVLDVSDILVCPADGATLNCMPPVDPADRACGTDKQWVQKNCKGVSFLE